VGIVDVAEFMVAPVSIDDGTADDTVLLAMSIDVGSSLTEVADAVDDVSEF